MRVTQHHIASQPRFRPLFVGGALLMALVISGCSAVNMTGFSFPVFGLNKETAQESDPNTTASIPSEAGEGAGNSQKLTLQ